MQTSEDSKLILQNHDAILDGIDHEQCDFQMSNDYNQRHGKSVELRWRNYDCDSDSEGYIEDSIDEELHFNYTDISKPQFRKEASLARWVNELGMAEVIVKKGKMWTSTGIIRSGKTYCSIEETLYLAEIGALNVVDGDDSVLLLSDLYEILSKNTSNECSWESFEVYKHLKFLGYIVGRHGVPWSLKNHTIDEGSVTDKLKMLQLSETKLIFDVYQPNRRFKKSSPCSPCSVLSVASSHPPSKEEIENLERRCGGLPLKLAVVEHGRISFLSFTKEQLPVLS